MLDVVQSIFGGLLVFVIVLAIVIFIIVIFIKRKVQNSSLGQVINVLNEDIDMEEIMKNKDMPKSLNGMDRIYLPQIKRDYPGLNIEEFRDNQDVLLISMLEALEHKDLSILKESAPSYKSKVKHIIEDMIEEGQVLSVDSLKIHNTVISSYKNTDISAEIIFQTALEGRIGLKDSSGRLLKGSDDGIDQYRFEQSLIYVIDPLLYKDNMDNALSASCPNCGAPASYENSYCSYCGSPIKLIDPKIWTFSNFEIG